MPFIGDRPGCVVPARTRGGNGGDRPVSSEHGARRPPGEEEGRRAPKENYVSFEIVFFFQFFVTTPARNFETKNIEFVVKCSEKAF